MKKLSIFLLLATLISCGKTETVRTETIEVNSEYFEGSYHLSDNSFIELFQSEDRVVISSNGQLLTSLNPVNSTFGEMPRFGGEYRVNSGKIKFTRNLEYTSGHDIEEDENGKDIRGNRRTDVTIEFVSNRLQITIYVYSNASGSNVNFIVAKRVFTQL